MTKEQKFYEALQDVFIGAKIEGEGGFVNLMRIKSNYYRKIEDILKKDIEAALKNHPKFRDELFDKLYSFFSRYFTESGSIYFNQTPFHNNIYEKVYTDEKDVILFWKTQMLYYVKTDRIFRSLPVEFDGFKFYFDASKIESKKANEKRSLIFELDKVREDGTIVFGVSYSEKGTKTKQDEILKAIKRKGIAITEEQLERAFGVFEKQSEVDFFINKNAKAFLQEQFKLWSYQYFWEGAKEWSAERVNQLQILKEIAFKIIDFISQFEDELVKIWNKPKLVKNSNYVITLDRITDKKLIEKIKKHKHFSEQVKEWEELGIDPNNPKAPIDTKYFKNLELEILSQFDDLDKSLDGWLIKSENYQALNTILPKFKEKVQTIYIDPPFNKEQDADYFYSVKYKDSSWATLLENRIRIAKDVLNEKGSIFVRCDYNGNWIIRPLMNDIFGEENFRNEISIKRSGIQKEARNKFLTAVESLFFYVNDEDTSPKELYEERETEWLPFVHYPGERKENGERMVFEYKLFPPKGRHWGISQDLIDDWLQKRWLRFRCQDCGYEHYGGKWGGCRQCKSNQFLPEIKNPPKKVDSNWTNIQSYSQDPNFPTRNAEQLLKRVIESTSNEGDLVMDFFLGSGTTTAVAHKLGRKWIGVEMGEHFYTVILPRMKKVLAYDKSGISKELKTPRQTSPDTPLQEGNFYQGGGFFKYYELEQYEEALANCKYEDGDLFNSPNRSPYQEYVFMKDEKMLKALEIDYENNKVKVDLSKLYPEIPRQASPDTPLQKGNIDIAETLSNLTGKWIKKITEDEVEFEDGTKINTKDLDYKLIKPLIWWEYGKKQLEY